MLVIAYDIGTTGIKTCLYEIEKGTPITMIGEDKAGYDLYVLDNGGIEQDPLQWWEAMCKTTENLLEETGTKPEEIKGISFCAQMQAVVLVDKEANPVRRAMSYMDNRSAEQMKKGIQHGTTIAGMNAKLLVKSLKITGAVSGSVKDPVWKYRWVADNEPDVFAQTYKWLDVKDFLVAKATGRFTMSRDSAFGTLLYDTRPGKDCFSKFLCDKFNVNMDHLPEIVSSTHEVGGINAKAAAELGLKEGTPVFSGGGDASLIGLGAGAVNPGDTHIYMGTSGWVSTIVDKQKLDVGSMIASIVGVQEGSFNCFAELETAGKCMEWARKNIVHGMAESYEEITQMTRKVPAGSNGLMFAPWMHGNRCPFEDPNARGMFIGIGLETTTAEMYRAIVEGVCMHIRWQMDEMRKLTEPSENIRFAGGVALSDENCQILADITGLTVEVVENPVDTGAAGAAALAATGLGEIPDVSEIKKMVLIDRVFSPIEANKVVYDKAYSVFRGMYKNNKTHFKRMADL